MSLLQTADQTIDIITMKFQKEIGYVIDTRKKAYILKFRNYDSFLYGPEQLIYF